MCRYEVSIYIRSGYGQRDMQEILNQRIFEVSAQVEP
jgi:hypothetical protein